jgi:hypothetical protein
MLALDGYLNIIFGYAPLFVFLRKGKQSAITTRCDGLSRQTLRFEIRSFPLGKQASRHACLRWLVVSKLSRPL